MEDLEPGTRIDQYQLIRPIGRGGMGSVWEAVNEAVGKRVAIKLLDPSLADQPEFMRRFELEARASALIDHPDIVDVLDTGTTEWGAPFMVMEYLQGITLRQLVKRFKGVTLGQTVAVVAPLLDALAAAHAAGIVHRDLKPANIFLAIKPRPSVKILDFGISKFQQSDGMTKTGVTLGTPTYMAPEQVRDSRTAGPLADLYAIGAILYALLSGRPPFEGDSDLAVVAQVLTEQPAPLQQLRPDLPPEACELVDACLSKDPQDRPPSAQALRESLLALATPDDSWLFSRVRELTPTESRPSNPVAATPSSRPSRKRATGSRSGAVRAPAEAPEGGATITNSSARGTPLIRWVLLGVGIAVLSGAAGIAWVSSRPAPGVATPEPVVVAPSIPDTEPAPPPTQIVLTLKAEPPEARWQVGDGPACNPCTVSRDQGAHLLARISAEGFTSSELNLDFDAARLVTVALQPIAGGKPPAVPPSTRRPGPKPKPKQSLELDESNPYPSQ